LIKSTQIRRFFRQSGVEGWSFLLAAKSLKTNSKKNIRLKSTQIRSYDSQAGSWSMWAVADSRATFSRDTPIRVGKQL
jgi:hypothetical protein